MPPKPLERAFQLSDNRFMEPDVSATDQPLPAPQSTILLLLIRLVGIVVFGISFLLPAVQLEPNGPGPRQAPMRGFLCAEFATMMAVSTPLSIVRTHGAGLDEKSILLPLTGLVNPLVLIYLILCIWQKLVRTRLVFAALILLCFIATWMLFAQASIAPLIGHFLWVAGAAALFVPDVFSLVRKRPTVAAIA
jgi:hypothetical protein